MVLPMHWGESTVTAGECHVSLSVLCVWRSYCGCMAFSICLNNNEGHLPSEKFLTIYKCSLYFKELCLCWLEMCGSQNFLDLHLWPRLQNNICNHTCIFQKNNVSYKHVNYTGYRYIVICPLYYAGSSNLQTVWCHMNSIISDLIVLSY